ncbi:MAG TPA: hypothetical protein VLH35_05680 [Candidatus Acidoferrales bacterium]|nr:hypothetical protein [Candidatus Acidoferrales bacterium]
MSSLAIFGAGKLAVNWTLQDSEAIFAKMDKSASFEGTAKTMVGERKDG